MNQLVRSPDLGKPLRQLGIAILASTTLLMTACGGGNSSPPDPPETHARMTPGQIYQIGANTSVASSSHPPAEIEVTHDFENNLRFVTLREGSADIYGEFVVME